MEIPRDNKHVSLILRGNKLLAIGTNIRKSHPITQKLGYKFPWMHSELNAVLKCQERTKLTLINARFNRFGQMGFARPCKCCLPWCMVVFDQIHYTTEDTGIVTLNTEITDIKPLNVATIQTALRAKS